MAAIFMERFEFGADVPVTHIERQIAPEAFEAFEQDFQPYIDQRARVFEQFEAFGTWPHHVPSREKVLEYFLTMEMLPKRSNRVVLDIASCTSLFPQYIGEKTNLQAWRQDLFYPKGETKVAFPRIDGQEGDISMQIFGGQGGEMGLKPKSIDLMTLHCSLEHFENDSDTQFVRSAMELLKPGGRILIIPFYCGPKYEEVFKPHFAPGCQFQRYYDPPSFKERILDKITVPFEVEIRYYINHQQIDSSFYCAYSISLIRKRVSIFNRLTGLATFGGNSKRALPA